MDFFDRSKELALLEELHRSETSEFFVLYGRRRVGKTELLRTFCRHKRHVFFVADQSPNREALAAFSQRLWQTGHGEADPAFTFPSWETAFRYLGSLAQEERLVVVLDEFPYLLEAHPPLAATLQKVWDEFLRETHIMLVLCGSYVGVMEREVLGGRSPLYGRRTGQYFLEPLSFRDTTAFFPRQSASWRVESYAVLGGMPAYLQFFRKEQDLLAGVGRHILRKGTFLYDEPRFLLLQELREPANYFSLLRAIAGGKTKLNEIAQGSALSDRQTVSRYLDTLREMGIVERLVPVTEETPHKSRKGHYRIRDQFFRFWFRFVYPFRSELEAGELEQVLEMRIRPNFAAFVGPVFEEVAREHLRAMGGGDALPFHPLRVGAWWSGSEEIDLVAWDEAGQHLLLGECKWWQRPVGRNVLEDLQRKGMIFLAQHIGRFKQPPRLSYALFSRSGFTPDLTAEEEVIRISVEDL